MSLDMELQDHCIRQVKDRATKQLRFCTWPVVPGELFCARHGGRRKTKKIPRYERWLRAMVKWFVKTQGAR
jgi:hypothetical protein